MNESYYVFFIYDYEGLSSPVKALLIVPTNSKNSQCYLNQDINNRNSFKKLTKHICDKIFKEKNLDFINSWYSLIEDDYYIPKNGIKDLSLEQVKERLAAHERFIYGEKCRTNADCTDAAPF